MSLLSHRPRFDLSRAARLAEVTYGLQACRVEPLPSERDQNVLLHAAAGESFVLKIANATEEAAFLEAQVAALAALADTGLCPRVVPTLDGSLLARVRAEGDREHLVRLVTFLPGRPFAAQRHRTGALFEDLGRAMARIDGALATFDHRACRREFHWDLARGPDVVRARAALVGDVSQREDVLRLTDAIEEWLATRVQGLRRCIIHNDANDHNVLVGGGHDLHDRDQQVTGIIDLGDMVHSWRAAEPAVAIAYAVLGSSAPLDIAGHVVRGYASVQPLEPEEIACIFPLALLRLCMSVCIAADQQREDPHEEYLAISQAPIREALPSLAAIPFPLAEARLRHACGWPAVPGGEAVASWLATAAQPAPVLPFDLRTEPCVVFDLGPESPLVDPADPAGAALTARLGGLMREHGVPVGVGQYLEPRLLYSSPLFQPERAAGEARTVHLGMDLFVPAGTPVHAPIAGEIHALADNRAALDYGPVVVLRHDVPAGQPLFTLYGHLSRCSLEGLGVGQRVAQGEPFASIGEASENGGWTPHLHLQIVTDLLGLGCDFPGVCRAGDVAFWRELSPDPNVLLGIPASRFPARRPSTPAILLGRRDRLPGNLRLAYREPLQIVRGWMQYLWDNEARRYLDAYNNVPHVGHCHPRVVSAGASQMALLNTNTRYLHRLVNEFAERLTATLPSPLRVCVFVNSASEANELALRLARAHTGARDTVVLEAAYHGHTTSLIDLSPYKHGGPGGRGAPPWVHAAPLPDVYRGVHRDDDPLAGEKYAEDVAATIARLSRRGRRLAAFIAETCPSVGGQIIPPPGYLSAVYRHVRAAGGLCIADEVQTGYGRLGTHFWAFEAQQVVPDIVVAGKPMGNGHPIGAVITTPDIAASFDNGMEFFSTFGGNPVSCAVGLAVLDVVRDERLQEHARRVGDHLLRGLHHLRARWPAIGDVRGSGLFLGVDLVRDRDTREPAGDEAAFVANRLRERRILLGTDGTFHNVLKIRPPMPFDFANADTLLAALNEVLEELPVRFS